MSAPAFERRIAYLTGYEENCGLNGLCHVILENIDNPKMQTLPYFNTNLLEAFKKHYNDPSMDMNRLKSTLKGIKNPVHLEFLLGPVLRDMLLQAYNERPNLARSLPPPRLGEIGKTNVPLTADEVQYLAAKFGVRIESYEDPANPSKDALRVHEVESKDAIATLRLSQLEGKGHWNRFVDTKTISDDQLKARNADVLAAYNIRSHYQYDKMQALLTDAIKNKKDVNVVLSEYDKSAPQTPASSASDSASALSSPIPSMSGAMGAVGSFFKGIFGLFTGKGDFGSKLTNLFQELFKFFRGEAPSFDSFSRAISRQIDPNVSFTDEELAKPGVQNFKRYIEVLSGPDASNPLYKLWRDNPNAESTWKALSEALKQKKYFNTVDELQGEREQALIEKNKDKLPRQYVEMIDALKKIDFAKAGDSYKKENIKVREDCYALAQEYLSQTQNAAVPPPLGGGAILPDAKKLKELEEKIAALFKGFDEPLKKAEAAQIKREKFEEVKGKLEEVRRERELADMEAELHPPTLGASGAPVKVESKSVAASATPDPLAPKITPTPAKPGSSGLPGT